MKRTKSSLIRSHSRDSFSRLVFESEHSNGGGHHNRSLVYRFCQFMVLLLRSITPLSYVFLIYIAIYTVTADKFSFGCVTYWLLLVWALIEALFFPYYYYLFMKLNNLNDKLLHFAVNKETRLKLVRDCFDAMKKSTVGSDLDIPKYLRKVIEGWFLDYPIIKIMRGNFALWTSWAFFGKDINDLNQDEIVENNEIIDFVENAIEWRFPIGYTHDVLPVRLNLDPVFATQRPFLFYATISVANTCTHAVLKAMGFAHLPKFDTPSKSQFIYYRPARKTGKGTNLLGYDGKKALPIIFVHGIGIGFAHYLAIITNFPTEVDVFLVEWPHVSMQMSTTGPTTTESVESIIDLLDEYNHSQASFVAHSLGTILLSWMVHDPKGVLRVASSVLIDPVIFLLCDPTVATCFVYKDPANLIDFLMHFFLSRELFIANALSRHFAWSHNIMFLEDLPNRNKIVSTSSNANDKLFDAMKANKVKNSADIIDHTIFLSSHDSIIPIGPVSRYLMNKSKEGLNNYELMMFHGTHGEMMLHPSWISLIGRKIRERCNLLPPNDKESWKSDQ